MSSARLVRLAVLSLAALAVAGYAAAVMGAEPSPEAARLDQFAHPDGTRYFALSLRPEGVAAEAGPRDVVILFDTSASQTGDYRTAAMGVLNRTLARLSPQDRVRLLAVDLNAIPMSEEFGAPNGPEMAAAVKKLDARVPLGAGDMEKALTAAVDAFPEDSARPRSVVYIGEGSSRANLLGPDEFEKLAEKLVDARVAVNSCPIGPRPDERCLRALAGRTGGVVVDYGEQSGRELAAAARGTVLWPTDEATWPPGFTVYPKRTPPLRLDRDTSVVGTFTGQGPFQVEIHAVGPHGPENLSWSVEPRPSHDENAYLAEVVEAAKVDGGWSLPIVGSASLELVQQDVTAGVRSLGQLARQALAAGNLENADRLATGALQRDPNDPDALAVKDAVARRRRAGGPAEGPPAAPSGEPAAGQLDLGSGDLELVAPGEGPFAGALAESFQEDTRLVAQVIKTQVQNAVSQARAQMGTNPEGAAQNLKVTLETVRQAPDLDPDVRAQLVDVIQRALRAADRRKIEVEEERQRRQQNIAIAQERMLISENLLRDQQRLRQLMERFNSLMDEGNYVLAEEAAAAEVLKDAPDLPAGVAATHVSRMLGYYHAALEQRVARQKGVVDTLWQAELAHIPMPDEPPIVYPDAEVWRQLTARRSEKYKSMTLASPGAAEKKINDALKSPTQLEFIETPMRDVIEYLKDYHDIEIQIDTGALDDMGIGTDTPITKDVKGISLRSALRLMLREMDLTYVIQDEVLLITTPEEAETRLTTKVYPVADLVLPINNQMMGGYGGMGGLGMGGTMGMGMGGMGMGMGGMGMGGYGMGMGGMGMGGQGMGMGGMMWSVPGEILPKVPRGGFRAFSVKDDLDVAPKPLKAPSRAERPEKISLEIPADADPQAVWDRYFTTHQPTPAAVRDAVRRLMKQQQFDHVIGLTQAALRHRQGQPWMYEVMAMAMQVAGRPEEEIERAVMSAVDLMGTSTDLMYVGAYLARLGGSDPKSTFTRRALQIFRQAAELEPARPEPYIHGLSVARRLDDLEGIQWATLGILSQAWTNDQVEVWNTGLRVANATLEKLRAEKRFAEAKQFEKALDRAVMRDCVAVVSWVGNADVDLLVEEPSGTVCSLRNPRTTAGGVMLGDCSAQHGRSGSEGYREFYVCPRGFDGTYRMLIRRVWGKVTAGKVTVEVRTHFRDRNEVRICKRVPLKNDEAVVAFDLKGGRRREPLREHEVANAAVEQLAVNRHVLAQQLAGLVDDQALRSLAYSRSNQANRFVGFPWVRGGAVGYQPVIITLPEGTNMMATAVISADRRYVRITCQPLFSGIAEVNTFNTATGEGTGGAGTGGQGFSGLFGPGGVNQQNQQNQQNQNNQNNQNLNNQNAAGF